MPVDATLDLAHVVELTMQRFPDFQQLEAHAAEAASWQARGRSLIAGRPQLQLRYQSDRIGPNDGLLEYEGGLQLPLWRWGERSTVRRLGLELEHESRAAALALHWEVAGLVREALWELELAVIELETADRRLLLTRQLTALVDRRQQLGDAARAEVLLARSAELDALVIHNEARARLRDAEVSWQTLTTLGSRPRATPEAAADRGHIEADHPALRLAEAAIARAGEAQARAAHAASQGPTLTVGPRFERPPAETTLRGVREDSLGMILSFPIGGSVHTDTAVTAAARDVVAARARRDQLLRELALMRHEAEHELGVARQNFSVRAQQAELTGDSLRMARSAYAAGELELAELLRIQERAIVAQGLARSARIVEWRQISRVRQALGELP